MSAVAMVCPKCKVRYVAGVVGMWAWPAHVCRDPKGTSDDLRVAALKDKR